MVDGTLEFDTSLDNSGFKGGVDNLSIIADNAIANIASNIVTKISAVAADIPAQMINVGSGFEASMSQVAATMGITSAAAEFDILSNAAKEMGETTKFSAAQAGEALNYLALAGYSAEKSVATLPTVLNVAAAGGMELAAASDMITDAMSALGLETSRVSEFSDQLAVTAQKSNTSVAQLGEAILTVGGTAKSLSGGVVEMNTALGILADNGIKGAEGGTALRNVILSLSAPTDKAAEALSNLNVTAFDSAGNMRPLQYIIADLDATLSQLTEQEKNAALNDIFNKVDLKAVNALLGTSAERFDELSGYISDCSGAAADMAETMDDNLKGDLTIMQSALEGLGIAAYEKFQNPLREAVQSVTEDLGTLTASISNGELSESFDKLSYNIANIIDSGADLLANDIIPAIIDGTSWMVDNLDSLAAVAAAASGAVVAYKIATNGAAAAQEVFNLVTNANPYVLLASAIVGVTAAVATYVIQANMAIKTQDELRQEADEIVIKSQAEADVAERKAERYKTLYEQYKLTGEASLEMKLLAEDLQKLAPDTIRLIDEETGAYNELDDSINNVIESMRRKGIEQAKQNTLKGHYDNITEYMQRQVEVERKYMEEMSDIPAELLKSFENGDFQKYIDFFNNNDNPDEWLNIDGQDISVDLFTQWLNRYKDLSVKREEAMQSLQEKIETEESAIQDIDQTFAKLYDYTPEASVPDSSPWAAYFQKQSEWLVTARQDAVKEIELSNEEITKKLSDGWKAAEHNYAMGVIGSEEELYARKQQLLNEYGNAELEEHWQYYEELIEYQKNYAKQSAEEYKQQLSNEWDTIDHQNKIGLLSDEDTYKAKLAFIQKYCPEYSDEWYDYYKDIYDYQKSVGDEQLETLKGSMQEQVDIVSESLKDIVSEYKEAYKKIQDNIDSYKKKLLSVGDALSVVENKDGSKTLKVNDLREQLAAMREYHKYMTELKNAGASAGLLSELNSMDFADSSAFAKNLAGLSSSDFAQINDYYKEKEQLAQELANELYQPDIDKLNTDLVTSLKTTLGTELPEAMRAAGMAALDEFIAGLTGNNLAEQVEDFGTNFTKDLSESIKNGINNDDFTIDFDNLFTQDPYTAGQNFGSDFADGFNAALEEMTAAVQAEQAQVSAEYTMKNTSAAAENADAAGTKSKTSSASERIVVENHIHAQLDVDGRKMAETTMQYEDILRREKGK